MIRTAYSASQHIVKIQASNWHQIPTSQEQMTARCFLLSPLWLEYSVTYEYITNLRPFSCHQNYTSREKSLCFEKRKKRKQETKESLVKGEPSLFFVRVYWTAAGRVTNFLWVSVLPKFHVVFEIILKNIFFYAYT